MKYIKELNINFNNWEEVDLDDKGPIKFNKSEEYYKKLVGKKVRIKKSSNFYYEDSPVNPADINGIIYKYRIKYYFIPSTFSQSDNNYYFVVKWNNGKINQYRIKDLELI